MMGAIETVQSLMRAGVEFAVDSERISWRNAQGRMTPEVIELIRAEKTDVLKFLTHIAPPVPGNHEARDQKISSPDAASSDTTECKASEPELAQPVREGLNHQRPIARKLNWSDRVVPLDAWRQRAKRVRRGGDDESYGGPPL